MHTPDQKPRNKLWTLFTSMLTISSFTFGGGFVIVTLMKRRFVDELGWMDEDEMLDIAAMAQSTPGAIAVNAAVLTGTRIGGTIGMLVAVLGTVIPPFVLLSVLSLCYEAFRQLYPMRLALAGMQAGVAAVAVHGRTRALDVAWGLGKNVVRKKDRVDLVLMALVFIAQWFINLNTAVIILSAAAVGLARGLIRLYGKGENRQ